jgi:hypothetical protein
MEDPASRLSFSRHNPRHQIAWDSTSLGSLKRCPRYYQYNIIEGYSSSAESPHLRFGTEYNNALVTYHKAKALGHNHELATLSALRYLLTQTWDTALNRPWTSDEPTKNRETLVRSVLWYLDKFADDSMETDLLTNGEPAVELSFRINTEVESQITGEHYVLCGYLDRKVNFNGGQWITDFKSTKGALDERYFAQYSPNNQVSQYAFAGAIISNVPISGIIIDAVQVGVTFSRFQRATIPRPQAILEEWFHDSMIYIRQNETFVANNYWPQNDTACSQYSGCQFRPICAASPGLRQKHLDALFHRRIWDPLVIREI